MTTGSHPREGRVGVLLAWIGGWGVLARHYPARPGSDGRRFWFRSARLGAVNYGGCLTLTVSTAGLRVSALPLFRSGHPPLFIPWEDVTVTAGRTWIFPWVELTFAQCPGPTFRIARRLAEALARESSGRPPAAVLGVAPDRGAVGFDDLMRS